MVRRIENLCDKLGLGWRNSIAQSKKSVFLLGYLDQMGSSLFMTGRLSYRLALFYPFKVLITPASSTKRKYRGNEEMLYFCHHCSTCYIIWISLCYLFWYLFHIVMRYLTSEWSSLVDYLWNIELSGRTLSWWFSELMTFTYYRWSWISIHQWMECTDPTCYGTVDR